VAGFENRNSDHEPPKSLPKDLISEEELIKLRIRINQSPNTKLYLRQSALEFPLFKDAAAGYLNGVVISLVDADQVTTKSVAQLPPDARLIWEVLNDAETKSYGEFLSDNTLSQKTPEFLKNHPEFTNKIFIYLAVGGKSQPNPKDSYPDPQWFQDHKVLLSPYRFQTSFSGNLRGFVLRHEIYHYGNESFDLSYILTERKADTLAFESIAQAWKKYKETGDSSGYSFVFVNKEGIMITANLKDQEAVAKI